MTKTLKARIEKLEARPEPADRLRKTDVQIRTATVDVKIVRVSGKQMTMSLFRQLDEEQVIGPDGNLKGDVWGRVNYIWKGCPTYCGYWVVWQDGDKLKRSPVISSEGWDKGGMKFDDFLDAVFPDWGRMQMNTNADETLNALAAVLEAFLALDQLFIAV